MKKMTTKTSLNIISIGMPGSGKSTVGPLLAQSISRDFLDTDVVIQASQTRELQDIVNTDGQAALRLIEEEILLSLACQNHVIATGGQRGLQRTRHDASQRRWYRSFS